MWKSHSRIFSRLQYFPYIVHVQKTKRIKKISLAQNIKLNTRNFSKIFTNEKNMTSDDWIHFCIQKSFSYKRFLCSGESFGKYFHVHIFWRLILHYCKFVCSTYVYVAACRNLLPLQTQAMFLLDGSFHCKREVFAGGEQWNRLKSMKRSMKRLFICFRVQLLFCCIFSIVVSNYELVFWVI